MRKLSLIKAAPEFMLNFPWLIPSSEESQICNDLKHRCQHLVSPASNPRRPREECAWMEVRCCTDEEECFPVEKPHFEFLPFSLKYYSISQKLPRFIFLRYCKYLIFQSFQDPPNRNQTLGSFMFLLWKYQSAQVCWASSWTSHLTAECHPQSILCFQPRPRQYTESLMPWEQFASIPYSGPSCDSQRPWKAEFQTCLTFDAARGSKLHHTAW